MKQKIRYIFLIIICACAWTGQAWGIDHLPISNKSVSIASQGGFDWSDKTQVLQFNGIPYKISFSYSRSSGAATGVDWYIDVSSDNINWDRLWSSGNNSGSESNIEITNHDVRYIKFCYSGNFGGNFTQISITEHPMVYTIDENTIVFGTSTKGQTVASKQISLTHINAAGTTIVSCSDNVNFSVSPTTISTGKDKWGKNAISVAYNNTNVGTHSATVTITDGTNTKTVSVSGTTQTTYYGQATAAASAGGNAYASFSSFDAATNTSATTNTANTTATSASKTAYFKATANSGYGFKGWIKGTGSYSSANVVSGSLTYSTSVTYTSESSGSPTVTTYKAWFAPLFYFSASATSSNETLGTASADVTEEIAGSVGATSGTVATTATFTATPKDDCLFLGWYTSNEYTGTPISTNSTYTEDLTNTVVGSTVSATPLYALFKKKQNLQWADDNMDLNLVLGATGLSSAASVTSGKTITYTSSNENALTIASDGSITTVGLGNSTVTASVPGDEVYRAETISREFNVGERKQATFTPSWGESLTTDIELGETATITLRNVNANFTVTKGEGNYFSWERTNSNTITITALAAGSTTLILSQPSDGIYLDGNSATYTITVTKHANPLAVAAGPLEMKVGDVLEDVITNTGNSNPIQVSYSTSGIATYDADEKTIAANAAGSTTITFTQAETTTVAGATKTIDVTVTKVANTLRIELPTREVDVDGTITLAIEGQNNGAPIVGSITEQNTSSSVQNTKYQGQVITYANGVITARNSGTATITFSQPATAKYTASSSYSFNITVNKLSNAITVTLDGEQKNSKNVARGSEPIALGYTSPSDGDFHVTLNSGSTATGTTLNGNSISVGNTDGTNTWTIAQDETYKYEAAETTIRIKVNSVALADSYLHTSLTTGNHSWYTGGGDDYEVSVDYIPSELRFKAWYTNATGVNESVTVVWKDAQGNQLGSKKFNLSRDQNEIHYVYDLPEQTRKFSFSATGSFYQYLSDVYVVRKTYIKASSDVTNLGTVYTDKTASATLTVEWGSSNGGDITIESNNPHFVASPSSITSTTNSNGTRSITLTYTPDPNTLGEESATVTVSDLFYSESINLRATAQKYSTAIGRGINEETEITVDGVIDNVFAFSGTSAAVPSAGNGDFYYTISHTLDGGTHEGDAVISYDPVSNTVMGQNAGTARLTIYQQKTSLYNATSQTFDFSVSRLENYSAIILSTRTLDVDGTATVQLTNNDSDGALSASVTNISYTNEIQNRAGGLLSFADGTLTGVNAGTATVTITQAETYKYVAKSASFDVTVNKLAQTLSWDDPDLTTTMQVNTSLAGNTATSSVGLTPVTYSSGNTAVITVDASTGVLTAVATGSGVGITATQAGNYKYLPATLTRQFSVFNKQTPAFTTDGHFTGTDGRLEQTCTATITVTGVGADSDEGFTITNGNSTIISAVRDGETITITGLAVGSTTLTLTQTGNDDYLAKTQTYNIEVYWPNDFLTLAPDEAPSYDAGSYRKIFLQRTLKAGYSTLALPFATTVEGIVGDDYDEADDWVAQLQTVTRTAVDNGTVNEYTLYFRKVEGGAIAANQPYVLHLGTAVVNPTWIDLENGITVSAASAGEHAATTGYSGYDGWVMHANYDADFAMTGKYGIVNTAGGLMLGDSGSTLAAFTAYIAPPASGSNNAPRLRVAYVDPDGTTTLVEGLPTDESAAPQAPVAIYGPDGKRRPRLQPGLNIVHQADGSVKKVMY